MDRRRRIVPMVMMGRARLPYDEVVLGAQPTTIVGYWPLNDVSGAAVDVKNGLNGAYSNFTLNQSVVDIDGKKITAPTTTTATAYVSLPTLTGFNGQEGMIMGFFRVNGAANWASGTRYLWWIRADDNNRIRVYETSTSINIEYKAGGTASTYTYAMPRAGTSKWFSFAVAWSKSGDYVKIHFNGTLVQTLTGLGTWVGVPSTGNRTIGQQGTAGTSAWRGAMAHFQIRNSPLSNTEISRMSSLNNFDSGTPTSIIYVSKTGNDANDGSQASPVLTIAQANILVNADETKEKVVIDAGAYSETITVPHGYLTYSGVGAVTVSGGVGNGLLANQNNITIEGLDFDTCLYGITQDSGATLNYLTISNCSVSNCTNEGIHIRRSNYVSISSVDFTACGGGGGLYLHTSANFVLNGCVSHDTTMRGYWFYSSSTPGTVTDCIAHDTASNGYGFEAELSSNNIIFTNCISYNNATHGFISKSSSGVQWLNCNSYDNLGGAGYYCKDGDTAIADGCISNGNGYGYLIDQNTPGTPSTNVTIQNGTIQENTIGISVQNSSTLLVSDYNSFIQNDKVGNWQGTDKTLLSDWQTASGKDAHSTSS